MQSKKIRSTVLIFWLLIIAFISAVSTTIFSESFFNDSFGISLIVFTAVGLLITSLIYVFVHLTISAIPHTNIQSLL